MPGLAVDVVPGLARFNLCHGLAWIYIGHELVNCIYVPRIGALCATDWRFLICATDWLLLLYAIIYNKVYFIHRCSFCVSSDIRAFS